LQLPWYQIPAVWTFGVAAIAFALFASLLSMRWRGEARSALLLAGMVLSSLWAASAAGYVVNHAPAMWRTAVTFDVLRLAALIGFVVLLLRGEASVVGRRSGWAVPGSLAILSVVALGFGYPAPEVAEPDGTSYLPALAPMVMLAIIGLASVEQLYRRTPDALRWNVSPLCFGLGALFAYDLVFFADALLFRVVDAEWWQARGLAQALAIPLLGMAAARNREWTFDVSLSRSVLLGSTAVAVAAAYLLVISLIGFFVRFFGGQWGTTLATVVIFGAVLFIGFVVASRTFRSKLRVVVAKHFLSRRYDYREEWLKFTRLISDAPRVGGPSLNARCILALGEVVETASGALWLRGVQGYRQVERLSQPAIADVEREDDALAAFLRSTGWVIEVEEARRDPAKYRNLRLPGWLLASANAWLVVPLTSGDDLVGFVVLGRPRVSLTLDWEVLDLLKTAGRQTAGHLAQAQATEALLESRKFESFNRMSAFVVHDLKNLVAQLQLMLRNAERHHANPDFQKDMLGTVGHVVQRMNQLMLQLRSGEQPVDRPHAVDLASVAQRVAAVRAAGRAGLRLQVVDGVTALGHEDRLERVIGHLVQNAYESISGQPQVDLRVSRRDNRAIIEVQDNGAGMTAEFVRDRLFKPFSSTKQAGMGIGTFESHQYVHSIGGSIEVVSRPGEGSIFRVCLLAADVAQTAIEIAE
jgi:putative PEP-CTERM system histidine kinase